MKNGHGYISVIMVLAIAILLSISIAITSFCRLQTEMCSEKLGQIKTFYLAEAGLADSISKICSDESWSTDLPHAANDKTWLINTATGSVFLLGDGGYKIVKENGRNYIYSIGFLGRDIAKSRSYSFQKVYYSLPFKQDKWEVF